MDLYCEMFVCSVQHICEYPFLSNPAYHVVSCADTGLCLIVCFVYCDNFFFFFFLVDLISLQHSAEVVILSRRRDFGFEFVVMMISFCVVGSGSGFFKFNPTGC